MAWRCCPNKATWAQLPSLWKPTPLQLYTPHSCIIDWFPHPELRDNLILNHNNSDILDQLFWDCMDCWVVVIKDISTIIEDAASGPGLIGVWNIIEAFSSETCSLDTCFTELMPFALGTEPKGHMVESAESDVPGYPSKWNPVPLEHILSRKDVARDLWYHLDVRISLLSPL